jgi:hypothetical protein
MKIKREKRAHRAAGVAALSGARIGKKKIASRALHSAYRKAASSISRRHHQHRAQTGLLRFFVHHFSS